MRMRRSIYGYDPDSVKTAITAMARRHVDAKASLLQQIEELRKERERLEAELAIHRTENHAVQSPAEGGDEHG